MKLLLKIVHWIWHFILAVWFAGGVSITFTLVFPLIYINLLHSKCHPIAHKIRRTWGSFLLLWGNIKVEQHIENTLNKNCGYVIVSNHTSKLDIITLPVKLGMDLVFMADEAFTKIPLFGLFFKTLDIGVNLTNKRKALQAYKEAQARLKDCQPIMIFPEGTISNETPKLSPFKSGAFKLAIEQQTDIVPVTLIKHWELLPDNNIYYYKPGKVIQYVHAPISTKGMTLNQTEELKQRVFHIIADKLAAYGYYQ